VRAPVQTYPESPTDASVNCHAADTARRARESPVRRAYNLKNERSFFFTIRTLHRRIESIGSSQVANNSVEP
jgi:hypothetical protein